MSGPRFKLPDFPADRPKVPTVRTLVYRYYQKPGNAAGGLCHAVLDDGNYKPLFLSSTLEECEAAGDHDGAAIMRALLQMTPSQRVRVIRGVYSWLGEHSKSM